MDQVAAKVDQGGVREANGTKREKSAMEKIHGTIMKKVRELSKREDNEQLIENDEGSFREISRKLGQDSKTEEKELERKNISDSILKERTSKGRNVASGGPTKCLTLPKPDIVEYETKANRKLCEVVVQGQDMDTPKLEHPLEIYIDGPFVEQHLQGGTRRPGLHWDRRHSLCRHPPIHYVPIPADEDDLPKLQPFLGQQDGGKHVQTEEGGLHLGEQGPEELRVVPQPSLPAQGRAAGARW